MVATLVRLKLRLLANAYRREVWRAVLLVLGGLYALGMLAMLALLMSQLAQATEVGTRQLVAVGAGSVLLLGWAVVPVLAFGVDDTLDPQRFTLFTVPSPRLAAGLVVAGAIGVPGLLTVLLAQLPVLLWWPGPHPVQATAAAVVGGLLGAATCLVLARVTTTAAGSVLRSRRGRDAAALAGLLLLVPLVVVPVLGESVVPDLGWLPGALGVLAWTPLGSAWAAPGDLAAGAAGTGLARLGISALALAVLALLWNRLLGTSMVEIATGSARRRRRGGGEPLAVAEALSAHLRVPGPAASVAARSLRYWRSDPRYLSNAIGMALGALALTVPAAVGLGAGPGQGLWWAPLVTAPLLGAFAGWTVHNDTAMDSTAYWMHLTTGISGRHDRLGRMLGAALWMVPAVTLVAVLGAGWSGRWDLLPATLGTGLGLLGAGLAVSAVASAALVYPVQPPGSSPFSSSGLSGHVGLTLLAQALTSVVATVLSGPVLVLGVLALAVDPRWGWAALTLGLVGGAGLLAGGVVYGGRVLDSRGPLLLGTMRGWSKH
ncbi:hypothetical protein PU560_06905 [Georgenia sp. 10Sc9-8]|uniref:Transporter n=1 Tax=Georgenia halotolerans TaxID=3028317 RepID=A0ABT5TVV4_9MICO|nr:hypothetical protein [Georgenia halotolerans]